MPFASHQGMLFSQTLFFGSQALPSMVNVFPEPVWPLRKEANHKQID